MKSFGRKEQGRYVSVMKMYLSKIINCAGRSHNGGFTFVEMLLSFSLFLVLTSFVPIGMHMLLEEGLIS